LARWSGDGSGKALRRLGSKGTSGNGMATRRIGDHSAMPDPTAGYGRRQWVRTGLALIIVLLACGVAQAASTGHLSVEDAAVIRGFFGQTTHLTLSEFRLRKVQVQAERAVTGADKGTPVGEEALGQLIEEVATEAEAERRGIRVGRRQVEKAFRMIRARSFSSPSAFRRYLRSVRLTEDEARHRVLVQLLFVSIEKEVEGRSSTALGAAKLKKFSERFLRRWRGRTVCLLTIATDRCSNGPPIPVGSSGSPGAGPSDRRSAPRVFAHVRVHSRT
jgi:hypothetical protein